MMKPQRKRNHVIVLLALLAYCQLIEAKGLCQFAEMFPSKGMESCYSRTKTSEDKENLTTRHMSPIPIYTTYQPKRDNYTTDESVTLQSTSQSITDQLSVVSEPPATVPLTEEVTSKRPTSTSSPIQGEFTSERQTTRQLIPTPPTTPPCAPTMVLGPSCECDRTCQDPTNCNCTGPETCVCPDDFLMNNTYCVPEHECGCYYNEGAFVIPDGGSIVNDNCSVSCTCSHNQLNCNSNYMCDPNATCTVRNGVRRCYCNDSYVGDGETCQQLYRDCYDAYQAGHRQYVKHIILPYRWPNSPFSVWCDMTTSGGGWTVIQRSLGKGEFDLNWSAYKTGFENSTYGQFWLGNDKLFYLTSQRNYTLRVDLISFSNQSNSITFQEYSLFKIANETDNYRLIELGNNSGTAGDGMDGLLGQQFSTKDRDNDGCDDINCSEEYENVGWWYSSELCNQCCVDNGPTCLMLMTQDCMKRCTKAHLNVGLHYWTPRPGIIWNNASDISFVEMKIRSV